MGECAHMCKQFVLSLMKFIQNRSNYI